MVKKIIFCCLFVGNLFSNNSELLISSHSKKNVLSKNEYKEQIGDNIKEIIDQCSNIVESIGHILPSTVLKEMKGSSFFENVVDINAFTGDILKIIGSMQKNFSNKARALIDNRFPFKKATRDNLQEINKIAEESILNLKNQNKFLSNLKLYLDKELKVAITNKNDKQINLIIKTVCSDLKLHLAEFKEIQTKITTCDHLK